MWQTNNKMWFDGRSSFLSRFIQAKNEKSLIDTENLSGGKCVGHVYSTVHEVVYWESPINCSWTTADYLIIIWFLLWLYSFQFVSKWLLAFGINMLLSQKLKKYI